MHAEAEAKSTRLDVIRSLKPHKAERHGLQISGEIDLLVIDQPRRRIWVVEAKAGNVALDPDQLLHDIIDFHGVPASSHPRWTTYRAKRKAYIPTLLTKTSEIQQQTDQLLSMSGVPADSGPWTVLPLMLTPSPVPAAYVPEPQVPFATLDSLATVLDLPLPPDPGPASGD